MGTQRQSARKNLPTCMQGSLFGSGAGAGWPMADFRESFSESCVDLAKGRKLTKVAGGARALGYSIVRASKILRFQAQKMSNSVKHRALHVPSTCQEAGPTL